MQYMQNIYRDDIIDNSICRKWYGKFGNGNFHLKDISYTGRPIITDSDKINTLIDYCHLITWDINQTLNISVSKYIYTWSWIVLDTWTLHKLSEKNLIDRISDLLLKWHNRII